MSFLRPWRLILFALVLGGGPLGAAPSREERAYMAATAAFQDEVWARAETNFAQFVLKFPLSTNAPAAVLGQAQAAIKQRKFAEALTLLAARQSEAGNLADQYEYWRAQAQYQSGDFAAAADTFNALAQNFPGSPLRLRAVVEAAAAQLQRGDWAQLNGLLADTNSIFQRLAQLDAANELVARGWLVLAQAEFAQKKFAAAAAILQRLNPATLAPELDWQRGYLFAQVKLGEGDLDAALAVTTNLTHLPKRLDLAVETAALRGLVLEQAGRLTEAMAAWSENLATNLPPERQREAVLKIAALATRQQDFPAAEAALKTFLKQFGDVAGTALVRLTLGELYLQVYVAQPSSNQLAAAQAQFDQLLLTATNGPLAGKAFLDRGWCFWLAGKYAESLVDFKTAAEQLPLSEDLAVAKFKVGDAWFAQTNFAAARENYSAVLTQFDELPAVAQALGDRALYQTLRASLELQDRAATEDALQRLLDRFPNSELGDKGLLLAGEGFSDFSSPIKARAVFQDFDRRYPDSPLRPRVALAVARTYEREPDWLAAIAAYEQWRGDFATNALRPQMEFALAQANFHAGNEALAFGQFTNFVALHATHPLAPTAQWWVADHFFRTGDFVNAEKNYQLLYQNWPTDELIHRARLMAGRAAAGRLGFSDAAGYFLQVTKDTKFPDPVFTQAMFAYGSVLTRMDSPDTNRPFANFELATNVFAQICKDNPTNQTGALAWSEIGDCDLQLSALDAATNAFAQVFDSPAVTAGLRGRAKVGFGLALEKKAALLPPDARPPLWQLALASYQDVYLTDDPADAFWIKKAGLQALALAASSGMLNAKDTEILYQRLELLLPQLKESLELKRTALSTPKN